PSLSSEVVGEDLAPAPAKLQRHIGPPPGSPIAVAARLRDQDMQEGVPVRAARLDRAAVDCLVELHAQAIHRIEDRLIAADPAPVARPGAALHVEAMVGPLRLFDRLGKPLRHRATADSLPDGMLMERLDRLEVLLREARRLQSLQVLRAIYPHYALGVDLVPDPPVVAGELVHHDAAVLAIAHL